MPNLRQIYELKKQYSELSPQDRIVNEYIEKSQAKDTLEKGFNVDILNEGRTRNFSFLLEHLNVSKPDVIKYFEQGKEEDVALLFIDITGFSKRIQGWTNRQIKDYLDKYYREIIPIIYDKGGEIEKLMGDGIIIVFGKPFLKMDDPKYVFMAEECAKDAIKKFHNTDKEVKVAIHKGVITYYKVPGDQYGEYTMVGQPITDLFRLESVSKSNAINFYSGSTYDLLGWKQSIFKQNEVFGGEYETGTLHGVDFSHFKAIQFQRYS